MGHVLVDVELDVGVNIGLALVIELGSPVLFVSMH